MPDLPELLTTREAAAYLKLAPHTLMRLARSGKVPCTKPTGTYRFLAEELAAWVRGSHVATVEEAVGRSVGAKVPTPGGTLPLMVPSAHPSNAEILATIKAFTRVERGADD